MDKAIETGSTTPRLTLGLALRQARAQKKMTLANAAAAIGVDPATLRRMEQGKSSSKTAAVMVLCKVYDIPDDMTEVMIGLAQETRTKGQWWHAYGDVIPRWFELYVILEAAASKLSIFDPLLISGLLQATEYTGAIIHADMPEATNAEIQSRVQLRRSRQQVLTRAFPPPPELDVILAEPVLNTEPGDGVMRKQIWHLLKATELPNVSLRILPAHIGPHRGSVSGAFTVLEFPTEMLTAAPPSIVYSENLTGAIYLDRPGELEAYVATWQALKEKTLDPAATVGLLSAKLKELNERESS